MDDTPFSIALYEVPQHQTFSEWLKTGKPGSKYIYATRHVLDLKTPECVLQDTQLAKEAYSRGEIELIQNRTEKNGPFQYIAVMKREKRVPLVNKVPWQMSVHQPSLKYRSRDWT